MRREGTGKLQVNASEPLPHDFQESSVHTLGEIDPACSQHSCFTVHQSDSGGPTHTPVRQLTEKFMISEHHNR